MVKKSKSKLGTLGWTWGRHTVTWMHAAGMWSADMSLRVYACPVTVRAELKTHQVRGSMLSPSTYSPHIHPVPPITNSFCLSVPAEITSNSVTGENVLWSRYTSNEEYETLDLPYGPCGVRSPSQLIFRSPSVVSEIPGGFRNSQSCDAYLTCVDSSRFSTHFHLPLDELYQPRAR